MTTNRTDDSRSRTDRKASWLALGFEDLVHSIAGKASAPSNAPGSEAHPFDVLIVGSGYGGAIAASELAGCTDNGRAITVCVLERGIEYLPGMFPGAGDELLGHVRVSTSRVARPMGRLEGLFDLRLGPDLNAVVANGLGGGSLINAGVMLPPTDDVLAHPMLAGLDFSAAMELLEPKAYPPGSETEKAKALKRISGVGWDTVPITVGLPQRIVGGARIPTPANVKLENCVECGDCATGCNFGAKNSLDIGLLVKAAHNGAAIYTGASVMRIERAPGNGLWIVHTVPTDRSLRNRHGEPLPIRAHKVILAAGTFGSTEILLRSRTDKLKFSDHLGRHFSANGDMLAVVHGQLKEANAIANEGVQPACRNVGPTIISMIDLRKPGKPGVEPIAIQEIAVPGPMRRIFEEVFTTALALQQLGEPDDDAHHSGPGRDPCSVDKSAMKRTTVIAMMGDDKAQGALELIGDDAEPWGDGAILVRWPKLRGGDGEDPNDSLFDRQMKILEGLVGTNGTVLPNPVWRLLPSKLSFLMDEMRGPPLTVHPLGGCAMSADRASGVVNKRGQVFDASAQGADAVFEGLVVLDGSIVPRALGINPALTISALALRAAKSLRGAWKLTDKRATQLPERTRPKFQDKQYADKPASEVSIVERLTGEANVTLPNATAPRRLQVELTVRYKPSSLQPFLDGLVRKVEVDGDNDHSFYRVFDPDKYRQCLLPDPHGVSVEARLKNACLHSDRLDGTLSFLHREPSTPCQRRRRALWGWFWNRGARDIYDFWRRKFRERGTRKGSADSLGERARGAMTLASRAGEVRRFDYALHAGGDRLSTIEGCKRLTYGFRCNLWEQLETLELTKFLGKAAEGTLRVDLGYFSANNTPLLRIETQHNLVSTMMDVASFAALITRIMINIHVWSFRRPDDQRPRAPQRLPGEVKRSWLRELLKLRIPMPRPRIYELVADRMPDGTPVMIRLTRYARFNDAAAAKNPVLLIHGYSASGTTFAHTHVRPNIAEELWNRDRDVWIVDLRTSAGMPTATDPWSFEDAALVDIPLAVDYVQRETGAAHVDVIAHCMGAAMLSMAVLKAPERGEPLFEVRANFNDRLGRVVLSQVGPVVQFTPINVLRADVMKYIRRFIAGSTYEFRVKASPSLGEQLLDRFLSSLRYPQEERGLENPLRPCKRTEFAGTRHRIDALYGRAFSLANMPRDVLENLDDFFGPLSLETVSQGMHLAKETVITDRAGRNVYLTRKARDTRWTFPTLTIHGAQNGMVDIMTMTRIDNYFNYNERAGKPLDVKRVEQEPFDTGHQDTFIGKAAITAPIFRRIVGFLEDDKPAPAPAGTKLWLISKPWIGPVRGVHRAAKRTLTLAAATDRKLGDAVLAICVAVKKAGTHWKPVEIDSGYGWKSSTYLFNARCDKDGWLSVEVSPNLLASTAEGFLFLLVYDQPSAMTPVQVAALAELRERLDLITPNIAVPANLGRLIDSQAMLETTMRNVRAFNISVDILELLKQLLDFIRSLRLEDDITPQVEEDLKKHPASEYDPAFIATPPPLASSQKPAQAAQIFVASCQYPNGLLDAGPAWQSYRRLGNVLKEKRPELPPDLPREQKLLLLVGDQIYSDATAGLADPNFPDERYRRPHEALFSREEVKAVMREIPTVMMLDDHEIADNWEPSCDDPRPRHSLKDGVGAYKDFQRRAGPAFHDPCDGAPDPLWFTHAIGPVNLFVADTRSERHVRGAHRPGEAKIMSECQFAELKGWLTNLQKNPETADAPKFVASPSLLLPRKIEHEMRNLAGAASLATSLRCDSWQGYPWSTHELLHHIVSAGIRNVIFLSGDEHLFCYAKARIRLHGGAASALIHSIHCSPLYAPLPFANAVKAEFAQEPKELDEFSFEPPSQTGTSYDCTVWAQVPEAIHDKVPEPILNGFTELVVARDGKGWTVKVGFHDNSEKPVAVWRTLTDVDGL